MFNDYNMNREVRITLTNKKTGLIIYDASTVVDFSFHFHKMSANRLHNALDDFIKRIQVLDDSESMYISFECVEPKYELNLPF